MSLFFKIWQKKVGKEKWEDTNSIVIIVYGFSLYIIIVYGFSMVLWNWRPSVQALWKQRPGKIEEERVRVGFDF